MNYECDPVKRERNLKKHGIDFDEAISCLLDPMALVIEDENSDDEERWILLGMNKKTQLLTVIYTMRGEVPRLISARLATKKEEKTYAQGI